MTVKQQWHNTTSLSFSLSSTLYFFFFGNAPVVRCSLNSWACSASGWGSTWHLQVLHYSSETLWFTSQQSWSFVGQYMWTYTSSVNVNGLCVHVSILCVGLFHLCSACGYMWESIIKSAGKITMMGAFLEIFAHTPQPLIYFAWYFSLGLGQPQIIAG